MVKLVMIAGLVLGALVACGGGKQATTTPVEPDDSGPVVQPSDDSAMVPPEKMDEIKRMLARKQRIMARCLADAVDAKELPPRSRGKITLEIVISSSGNPDKVAVIKSSLESPKLIDCVISHVKSIRFPELPRTYPTSYTYAFEAS